MIEYRRILCPIDFSDISDNAFQIAVDLAEQLKADLHVIHVFQLPASNFPDGIYCAPDDIETQIEGPLLNRLDEFVKDNATSKINITTGLYEGIPHIEITSSADENNADMIVMGTHGRTGLSHVLLGSVAERVIHTSKIPVLTVRKQ
jgi:nucleotide-binding universal stress UspA family protein